MIEENRREKAAAGVKGFDYILKGGFLRDRIHLIQGATETGKTTLGLLSRNDGEATRGPFARRRSQVGTGCRH